MRVVVAEDIMLTREGIVQLLRNAGIDVVAQAGDAEALLREVRQAQPDVAVVDIRMPPTHTDEGLVAAQAISNIRSSRCNPPRFVGLAQLSEGGAGGGERTARSI